MIIRIWRTRVKPSRSSEYEKFAQAHSLPMFRQQAGCLGVLFLHTPHDHAARSLWENAQAVEQLASSPPINRPFRAFRPLDGSKASPLLRSSKLVAVF